MSLVEDAYNETVNAMTTEQKFPRVQGYYKWVQELYARQITEAEGEMPHAFEGESCSANLRKPADCTQTHWK